MIPSQRDCPGRRRWPTAAATVFVLSASLSAGCFGEKSFAMVEADLCRLTAADIGGNPQRLSARDWAPAVHGRLAHLLEPEDRAALCSADLIDADGMPVNLRRRFGWKTGKLQNVFYNFYGLLHTAQVVSGGYRGTDVAEMWPGFEPVEFPMADGLILCGRLAGPTRPGIDRSYIVIAHGLFGNLHGADPRNQAEALRAFGHHVVSIEMRGHGSTQQRNPAYPIQWGVAETRDLLSVSRRLRTDYGAKRVGLVAFCSSSHHALLTAWVDGRAAEPTDAASPIFRTLPKPAAEPEFNAGMFVVSPPIDLVGIARRQNGPAWFLSEPITASLEERTATRLVKYGEPPSHRIWDLILSEIRRSSWMRDYPDVYPTDRITLDDYLRFMDLAKIGWKVASARMERIRVPVLVLQAANDPLARAKEIVTLFAPVKNPNCSVLMLRTGGHTGFSAWGTAYYYSLMRAFFDPETAPETRPTTNDPALR